MTKLLSRAAAAVSRRLVAPLLQKHYRLAYQAARLRWWHSRRAPLSRVDAVFLVHERNRGWVLEGICREIAGRFPGASAFHYSTRKVPPARAYFISHYSMLPTVLKENPHVYGGAVYVWYTHPRPIGVTEQELVLALNATHKIFCPNSWLVVYLNERGVRRDKLVTVLGGADPTIFRGHARGHGAIGFSMAFYERKRPERVLEIARAFPGRSVILLGRGWPEWARFSELERLPNFRYIETSYAEYPAYYAQMDVFVSPAVLEGGPIPLLEAMMSNAVPVASDTGFARDLISHGDNGYVFDVNASSDDVIALVRKALDNRADVRATVAHLSWDRFAREICAYLVTGPVTAGWASRT